MKNKTISAIYQYNQNNGNLKKVYYDNGANVQYTYDSLDRVIATCYNGVEKATYVYTPNGQTYKITDLENGITYQYAYDGKGVMLNERAIKNGKTYYNKSYGYDDQGRIMEKRIILPENDSSKQYRITYQYNSDGSLYKTNNVYLNLSNTYEYDALGRLTNDTLASPAGAKISKDYTYNSYTVGQQVNFSSEINKVNEAISGTNYETLYEYDVKGNITRIIYKNLTDNSVKNIYYTYDSQNQLVREDNEPLGYTYCYSFDYGGNIRCREVWNYQVGTITQEMPIYYEVFGYNSVWKDVRESYTKYIPTQSGAALQGVTEYDSIGNPLSYYNGSMYTFTWEKGRQLATATIGSSTYTYKYNQDGIRISKQYGNTLTEYILDGTKIIYERVYNVATNVLTSQTIYSYDSAGTPNGAQVILYSGETETVYNLYFRTNIQGDVLAIYNKDDNDLLVQFNYDAWGNYTTIASNSTLAQIALNQTHLRYRGYYQDAETELYYLNSRYYDAKMCRFLNADSYVNANGDFVGFNMFAYCSNNPVMYVDMTGEGIVLAIISGVCLLGGVLLFSSCENENTDLSYKQIPMKEEPSDEVGVVYYSIGSVTENGTTEPSIKIYNSYNYRTIEEKKKF